MPRKAKAAVEPMPEVLTPAVSAPPVAPGAPAKSKARTWMIYATLVLALSKCFTFTKNSAYLSETYSGEMNHVGASSGFRGYESHVNSWGGGPGFSENSYAFPSLIVLVALFMTPLYRRWGSKTWGYWVGLVAALPLMTALPPPMSTPGGAIASVGLVLVIYAIYLRMKEPKAVVAGAIGPPAP